MMRQPGTSPNDVTPSRQRSRIAAPDPGRLDLSVAVGSEGERLVALVGELDVASAPRVARVLRMLVDRRCNTAVDASELAFIDATGVAALLTARNHADACGRAFALVSPSACVLRMLELTATRDLLHGRSPVSRDQR